MKNDAFIDDPLVVPLKLKPGTVILRLPDPVSGGADVGVGIGVLGEVSDGDGSFLTASSTALTTAFAPWNAAAPATADTVVLTA